MGVCVFSWLSAPCVLSCYCRVVRRMFAVDARLVLCGAVGAVVFPVVFVYLLLGCLLCLLVFVATLPCPKCRRRSLGHMVAATFRSLFIGPWGPGESLARAALVITALSFVSRSRRCCTLLVHAASRLRYLFCCSRVMRPWLLRDRRGCGCGDVLCRCRAANGLRRGAVCPRARARQCSTCCGCRFICVAVRCATGTRSSPTSRSRPSTAWSRRMCSTCRRSRETQCASCSCPILTPSTTFWVRAAPPVCSLRRPAPV
jgi:hypothetical protein